MRGARCKLLPRVITGGKKRASFLARRYVNLGQYEEKRASLTSTSLYAIIVILLFTGKKVVSLFSRVAHSAVNAPGQTTRHTKRGRNEDEMRIQRGIPNTRRTQTARINKTQMTTGQSMRGKSFESVIASLQLLPIEISGRDLLFKCESPDENPSFRPRF